MRAYLFYLILLCTSTIQGQNPQFEGIIEYEVTNNSQLIAIEKHYFRNNMIRIESFPLNESKASFTYIHYFHGDQKDSIFKAIGPHVHYNLDSNIYNIDIYPEWTDMVESVVELPNQKINIKGFECEAIEVSYKRPQAISDPLSSVFGSSHKQTVQRWLSKDLKFHLPKGNYFNWSDYMVAYYNSGIALKAIIIREYDDFSTEIITRKAINIQPRILADTLFSPMRITNKLWSEN